MIFTKKQKLLIVLAISSILVSISFISHYQEKKKVYYLSFDDDEIVVAVSENTEEIIQDYIVVHVEGEVRFPGAYELPQGSRVMDVIEKAGGLTESADRTKINLAKIVYDENFIYVPAEGEEVGVVGQPGEMSSSLININTASKEELKKLNGIGDALADRIIEYRNKNGPFRRIEDIKNVSGIGDAKFNNIKGMITVK